MITEGEEEKETFGRQFVLSELVFRRFCQEPLRGYVDDNGRGGGEERRSEGSLSSLTLFFAGFCQDHVRIKAC